MELPRDKIVTYSYDHEIGEVRVHTEMLVRCKDCKHYDEGLCCKGMYDLDDNEAFSHFYPFAVFKDDFCSKGERREDNDTD